MKIPAITVNGRQQAFTLVELLLGLVITAIIGASVYSMFWTSVKLDDRMRHAHENYMEVLMADLSMTQDLENAISLDLSGSYPDAVIFDGKPQEFSFLTQTPTGIKRVRYYSGLLDSSAGRSMIGRVVNSSSGGVQTFGTASSPVEFLIRQESNMADWLNETTDHTSAQIVAAGFKKGSFNCQYAPFSKDLHTTGESGIDYQDSWDEKGLPMAVSCSFVLYDPQTPKSVLMFKRDIFLAPVASYHNEQ